VREVQGSSLHYTLNGSSSSTAWVRGLVCACSVAASAGAPAAAVGELPLGWFWSSSAMRAAPSSVSVALSRFEASPANCIGPWFLLWWPCGVKTCSMYVAGERATPFKEREMAKLTV